MSATIHAGAVALGPWGVLVRGAPGAGKTALALALIARWHASGHYAALVADDRVDLRASNGRLVARPAEALRGLAEIRGYGIAAIPYLPAVRLTHVADLEDAPERMPDPSRVPLRGAHLPRICLFARQPEAGATALWTLLQPSGS
ncbi:HPr kinase/phosphatase C-terminal domain-containing protein [Acuticoccus sp. MNP-M23]|uniref:HPr kinase/phosphorylase n=1 Tax=Acuticoccus sp. MNP-M23 TaxID=3072793 RepID=UPI002814D088|nr:HPr kinase/phosphatase C-terminal domain-containing protein [Acuticoccus sp. MNP-M23]WMS44266.1 HPr kinase/phosphatase C-terminal domain-containing protein [Acuticoccus sp. MNP-M23]